MFEECPPGGVGAYVTDCAKFVFHVRLVHRWTGLMDRVLWSKGKSGTQQQHLQAGLAFLGKKPKRKKRPINFYGQNGVRPPPKGMCGRENMTSV